MKDKSIIIILIIAILIISCKGKDGITGPQGEVGPQGETGPKGKIGPKLFGELDGLVFLIDKYGKIKKEHSGVKVKVVETNDSTSTDSFGYWIFDSLVTGTYTLEFEKDNYGKSTKHSFQFTGGGITHLTQIKLGEKNEYSIQITSLSPIPGGNNIQNLEFSPIDLPNRIYDGYKALRIFVGNNLEVSSKSKDYIFTEKYKLYNIDYITLTISEIVKFGFNKGDTMYITAYCSNPSENDSFLFDFTTGKKEYTDISKTKSNIISYIIR